ncbi:MAG: hypothetical protein LBT09_09195 [Planctomycetaceae bacterium]|jgi:hypothetical protein|nr:hypothetical protein [Planctomycetaceae bacterium]
MIHIKSRNLFPDVSITKKELAQLLFDTINYDYKTVDELAAAFGLADGNTCKEGFVFTNAPPIPDKPNIHPYYRIRTEFRGSDGLIHSARWETDTLGFVTNTGICLLLYNYMRVPGRVALGDSAWADKFNLPYTCQVTWLMAEIYESDGKTLVLPRGEKELPRRWKMILDERELLAKMAKEKHERTYRKWHGRNGKVLFHAKYITLKPKKEIVILQHDNEKFVEHKKYEFAKEDWDYVKQKFKENPEELSVHDGQVYTVTYNSIDGNPIPENKFEKESKEYIEDDIE